MPNSRTDNRNELLVRLASAAVLLAVWWAAAVALDDSDVLPRPDRVATLLWREATAGPLLYHLGATLLRVMAAFVLAMSIGIVLGLALGRSRPVNRWFDTWLVFFLNLPALVIIVICYLWIGLTEVAAITAVAINKIPLVTVMIREGARAFDPSLDALSMVYRLPLKSKIRHVLLPQLAPQLAASARAGVALIWKIVLVVEFLGRPDGVGFQIHLYFQLFDAGMVLAYALAFIAVMLAVEAFILRPWERSANAWRRA